MWKRYKPHALQKKKLCCNSKKIKAFWLLAQPKKKCISIEKVCKISKKRNQTTDSLFVLGDQCQVWFECSRLFWLAFSLLFKLNVVISRIKIYNFKRHDRNVYSGKAELLQLNRTQFSSLGIFVSKKVGNQKN